MDISEFNEHLIAIRELMIQEKYSDALVTIDMLKELDKKGDNDFSYNLMHQLYQLNSLCKSAFHQQIILKIINDKFDKKQSINFTELSQILRENDKLKIDDEVLKKEVELLILRNLLKCKIEGNQIIFLT